MNLTCARCLAGDSRRCLRGDCANWKRQPEARPSRSTRAYGPRRGRYTSNGNPVGRPTVTTKAEDHEIASLLVVGNSPATIMRHRPWGKAPVYRVRRALKLLESVEWSAGVPEAPMLPRAPRPQAKNLHPYGARVDREAGHTAALLLIEGATYDRAAELAGITYAQARTVRRNLSVLASV